MNKKVLIGLLIVVVLLVLWMVSRKPTTPASETETANTASAVDELAGLDSVDLQSDMQAIDEGLDQL